MAPRDGDSLDALGVFFVFLILVVDGWVGMWDHIHVEVFPPSLLKGSLG